MECNVKEGIFEINTRTPKEMFQPILYPTKLIHPNLDMSDKVIETLIRTISSLPNIRTLDPLAPVMIAFQKPGLKMLVILALISLWML